MPKKTGIAGKNAFELFPEIMKNNRRPAAKGEESPRRRRGQLLPEARRNVPEPPPPPDLDWLRQGVIKQDRPYEDTPVALLLMARGEHGRLASEVLFTAGGYHLTTAGSEEEAIAKTGHPNLELVILEEGFGGETFLERSRFHRHMQWLPMAQRRLLYYVLIGPRFHTAYDLQALALSANLVINSRDLENLALLLRKGLHEHEILFGPYLEVLKEYGRK